MYSYERIPERISAKIPETITREITAGIAERITDQFYIGEIVKGVPGEIYEKIPECILCGILKQNLGKSQ